jgi:uncharacterized protein (TIGR02145 family)
VRLLLRTGIAVAPGDSLLLRVEENHIPILVKRFEPSAAPEFDLQLAWGARITVAVRYYNATDTILVADTSFTMPEASEVGLSLVLLAPQRISSSLEQSSSSQSDLLDTGNFTDLRDLQTYPYITLGRQVWMAKNLNFDTLDGTGSWCYENQASNCNLYGRLYNWSTSLALPASCNSTACSASIQSPHRGLCPSGWHVPSDEEWKTMEVFAGMSQAQADSTGYRGTDQGTMLKANSSLWSTNTGSDSFGFSALPGGLRSATDSFAFEGTFAQWWTATEAGASLGQRRYIYADLPTIHRQNLNKYGGNSLRCIRDTLFENWSQFLNPTLTYDSLVDGRDGQEYATIWIASQHWMAQNLNFGLMITPTAGQRVDSQTEKYCAGDSAQNCSEGLGGLYQWAEAMALPSTCNNISCADSIQAVHQGICPAGWRIPSPADWDSLTAHTGGSASSGAQLKSNSTGYAAWNSIAFNSGNPHGFSIVPVGDISGVSPAIEYKGTGAMFWLSAENLTWGYERRFMSSLSSVQANQGNNKIRAYNIRCIEN